LLWVNEIENRQRLRELLHCLGLSPKRRTVQYTCPIKGCTNKIDTSKLFCYPHWKMVPRTLQQLVNHTWRTRLDRRGDPAAVEAHQEAKRRAIAAVEARGAEPAGEQQTDLPLRRLQ
jgi:hypothetical protein